MFNLPRLVVLAPFIGLKKKVKYALLFVFFVAAFAHRELENHLTWVAFLSLTSFTWSLLLVSYIPVFIHDGGPINSRFDSYPSSAGFQISQLLLAYVLVLACLFMLFGGWLSFSLLVSISVVMFSSLASFYFSQFFKLWEISE